MAMHNHHPFPVEFRESRRARRVLLRITPRETVELVAPPGCDPRHLDMILRQRTDWIAARLDELRRQRLSHGSGDPHTPPATLPLRSLDQTWTVRYAPGPAPWRLRSNAGLQLTARGPLPAPDSPPADHEPLRQALTRFCRSLAAKYLPGLVHDQARALGFTPDRITRISRITVRAQTGRWGSCSSTGSLNLNFALAFLPPEFTRYVITHELCHLTHLNHSADFWNLVCTLMPDARRLDKQLRDARAFVPAYLA